MPRLPRSESSERNRQAFPIDLPRGVFRRGKRQGPLPAGQPDSLELAQRLKRFEMFATLSLDDLHPLAEAASVQVYRAEDLIWSEGERCCQVLFIEQGLAKAARRNRAGVSRTYGLYGPGDSMGIYALWAGMKYPTDAQALNDGMTAILLDPEALVDYAERHVELVAPLMIELSRFTESFIRKIGIISAGTIAERLAALMIMLIERYGVDRQANTARVPINLTLEHLSDIVDARIETVARVLSGWKRAGWLVSDAAGFHIISLDKLRELLPVTTMGLYSLHERGSD
jgi:CRP/FNR family transcriptional regulator, nitrogen oxide reductase regulator